MEPVSTAVKRTVAVTGMAPLEFTVVVVRPSQNNCVRMRRRDHICARRQMLCATWPTSTANKLSADQLEIDRIESHASTQFPTG
jgi:hypothetical protein